VSTSARPRRRVTVLGAGYTGRFLIRRLLESGYDVVATSRRPPDDPASRPNLRWIPFDLENQSTYRNVTPSWGLVWLFPPLPLPPLREFAQSRDAAFERTVVVGTTSSYLQKSEGDSVTEAAPLDVGSPRVEGEALLQEAGALVLRSAGIYGPGRNPLDWLRWGRISGGAGYVNLLHADDLAAAIVAGLESSIRSEHFIVTDGTPMPWGTIAAWAMKQKFLSDVPWSGSAGRLSRRLSNAKMLSLLHPPLTHTDLFGELKLLEGGAQLPNMEVSPAP
jgi:nucleoside-diphosphate-sugar epimerase